MSSYSCVAKAGYGAKLQWFNASGRVVPEYSPDNTNSSSVYVTYSMYNKSTELKGNNSIYTGDPIYSVYPVHNATLHINGTHNQSIIFTCAITGVKKEFLQQYNVSDNKLSYQVTVYISGSSSATVNVFSGGSIVGITISIILILAVIAFIILFCYGKCRRSKRRKLSIDAPFKQLNAELVVDLKYIDNNSKLQFPREKISLLEKLGELSSLKILLIFIFDLKEKVILVQYGRLELKE